jgi:hypothetical protein
LVTLAGAFHPGFGQVLAPPPPPPPSAVGSQAEPPADLRLLKAGFRRSLLAAALPEMKAHREELLALEKKLAAAQDFAGAVKARDERAKLERQIGAFEQEAAILDARPAVENAARLAARIELKLSDAKLTGSRLDGKDGAIVGWDQPNASATWQLPGLPPGGYEVLLRCTGHAGEVIIKEAFYSLTTSCKATTETSLEQNLGVLRIRAGTGSLTLGVAQPEKCSEWRVYSVVLVPPSF